MKVYSARRNAVERRTARRERTRPPQGERLAAGAGPPPGVETATADFKPVPAWPGAAGVFSAAGPASLTSRPSRHGGARSREVRIRLIFREDFDKRGRTGRSANSECSEGRIT